MTTPAPSSPINVAVPADPGARGQIRQFAIQVSKSIRQHVWDVRISAAAESTNVRRVTIQLVNRAREPVAARVPLTVLIASTQSGTPTNAQTVSVVSGTLYATYTTNAALLILTDSDGKIELDVTVAGAATRWITAVVPGWAAELAFDWTA